MPGVPAVKVRVPSCIPADVGLPKSPAGALAGGDAHDNAKIIEGILDGRRGPARDVVLLNAGAALFVAGAAKSVDEVWKPDIVKERAKSVVEVKSGWLVQDGKAVIGAQRQITWWAGGVRPEDVRLSAGPADGGLWMDVLLVELLGDRRVLTLRRQDGQVTLQAEGGRMVRERDSVAVGIDLSRAHLFDRAGGAALWHGRPEG